MRTENNKKLGLPGWLGGLSMQLSVSAQVLISVAWVQARHWAPCWAWNLLKKKEKNERVRNFCIENQSSTSSASCLLWEVIYYIQIHWHWPNSTLIILIKLLIIMNMKLSPCCCSFSTQALHRAWTHRKYFKNSVKEDKTIKKRPREKRRENGIRQQRAHTSHKPCLRVLSVPRTWGGGSDPPPIPV